MMDSVYLRRAIWLAAGLLLISLLLWAGLRLVAGGRGPVTAAGPDSRPEAVEAPAVAAGELPGSGFVVWESNRTGRWRLWIRQLDGSDLRQLTAEEGSRAHCCPHIAPDGSGVAYLSLEPGPQRYPDDAPERGVLRLIQPDGGNQRVLADSARTYGEHRAAVWHSTEELVYLDGEGYTVRLRLPSGDRERLTLEPPRATRTDPGAEFRGWLVNSRLSHATTGVPTFSLYAAEGEKVTELQTYGGCQPYFSPDGRWGYWVAGAGGPIDKIDLESRVVSEVLAKNDARIPGNQGYMYFPMLSPCSRLLAYAASDGEHHHFRANYDVYVAETDPERLEVVGTPVRYTSDPATDRFPAVFLEPQPLGFHTGEAPFTVVLTPAAGSPAGDPWQWDLGDGTERQAREIEHTYERPGSYAVRARRGEALLTGWVRVRPARPPQLAGSRVRDGRWVVLRFDEKVDAGPARLTLASGREISGWKVDGDGRELVVELAATIEGEDTLRLADLSDRAQQPNLLPSLEVPVTAEWPGNREGLLFLWETSRAQNRVFDPLQEVMRSFSVKRRGQVRLDHAYRMDLGDGRFVAAGEASETLVAGIKASNELTVEATITPRHEQRGAILAFSAGRKNKRNLVLTQDGDALVLSLLTAGWGPVENTLRLGRLPPGEATHLVVSYRPGRLVAFMNGRSVLDTQEVQGDFFHWQSRPLWFGGEHRCDATWNGILEGVAFYARFPDPEEVRENARRYLEMMRRRPPVPSLRLRGRLLARARNPTLEEITPYRDGLAVFEYQVERVLEGEYSGDRIRVAHLVILDDEHTPAAWRREGESLELLLEPFAANPQLEPYTLSDSPEIPPAPELYYATDR
ncbi:MAG: PKD domain-containing protein [bacterium]|nr:PKD domain-containing protein [bacterium]